MFSENLKLIRESKNLSKPAAAQLCCMTYQQYDALEREGSNPTLKTIERIASSFGVSKNKLIGK